MVSIADGRFILPDKFYYTKNQHVYVDLTKKIVGLDEIGYVFLNNPNEIKFLVDTELKVGSPFVAITTEKGITTLNSPVSGKIKKLNTEALKFMKEDTYTEGYLVELEEISEKLPTLLTGEAIAEWAKTEVQTLLRNNYSIKVILIGDTTVGKTAIKVRFTDNYFKKDLKSTLGVDFGSKEIKGEYMSTDILFSGVYRFTAKMNVWDAAGQSVYDKIRSIYYRDAKGAILAYDVANIVTFKNLDKWIQELEENCGKVPVLLVGNKTDLERTVSREEGLEFAMDHNFMFMESSAKNGEGIEEMFQKLAVEIFRVEEGLD
jgi:Ras-related protein Rab-2A